LVSAVHDISDGGAVVAIAEMALAGDIGADLVRAPFEQLGAEGLRKWFAEDQARYVVTTADASELQKAAHFARIPLTLVGYTGGSALIFHAMPGVTISDLRAAHDSFFPKLMGGELTPEL
jgi:phosphoribosylformylglycinamidine synthase